MIGQGNNAFVFPGLGFAAIENICFLAGIGDNASVNTIARLNAPVLRKDFPTACITALRLFVSAAKSFLSPYHMQKLHPAAFK